jgi:hypothetical protein
MFVPEINENDDADGPVVALSHVTFTPDPSVAVVFDVFQTMFTAPTADTVDGVIVRLVNDGSFTVVADPLF